jgi:hypothetical protein
MVKRGRPFEPGNKLGRGRPRGSRNKKNLVAQQVQQMLESNAEALVRKAMLAALKGDIPMLRTLLGHLLPRHREPPVKIGSVSTGTAEGLAQTSEAVLKKVASGQIGPKDANDIFAILEAHRKIIETRDLDARMRAIEQRVLGQPGKDLLSLGPGIPQTGDKV